MIPLGLVLFVGTVLRVAWVMSVTRLPVGTYDPLRYLLHAIDLAEGGGYSRPDDGNPTAYYPVGYPLALSLLYRGIAFVYDPAHAPVADLFHAAREGALTRHADSIGHLVVAGAFLNIVLGVATIALVYRIARRLGGIRAAILAAALVACFPNLIFHTGVLLTETLFIFFLVAALAVLFECFGANGEERTEGKPRTSRLLFAGALFGCAALVRPIVLVLLPIVPIALVAARSEWRTTLAVTVWVGLGCVAVLAPWSIRNWRVMDAPILVSTNMGDNLCIGHQPGAPGHFAMPRGCRTKPSAAAPSGPAAEVRRNAASRDRAIRFALENPAYEWELLGKKLYYLFHHDHNGVMAAESYGDDLFLEPSVRSTLERAADLYFFGILGFGCAGLLLLAWPPWEARQAFLALAILGLAMGPLIFFGHPRFHVPLSPLLAIAGAVGLAKVVRLARASARTRSA